MDSDMNNITFPNYIILVGFGLILISIYLRHNFFLVTAELLWWTSAALMGYAGIVKIRIRKR